MLWLVLGAIGILFAAGFLVAMLKLAVGSLEWLDRWLKRLAGRA